MQVIERLRRALAVATPGAVVWVYGSLLDPRRFSRYSDIDLAMERNSSNESVEYLQSVLTEATGHGVDIVWLSESRLEDKIRQTGSQWTV